MTDDRTAEQVTLLERQGELAVLAEALRSVERAEGTLVVITGPLGSGRSALLYAVRRLRDTAGAAVLVASGSVLEQDYAFGITRQLLAPAVSGPGGGEPSDRWLTGPASLAKPVLSSQIVVPGKPLTPSVQSTAIYGLQALIEGMSRERAVVLLVDDLQWADDPSLRWLGHLSRRLSRLRVLLVVTTLEGDHRAARPLIAGLTGIAQYTLHLKPLSLAGTRDLVRLEADEADDEFVAACYETTFGNPMFLKAIMISLAKDGIAVDAANADLVRVRRPPHLRRLMVACLQDQPEAVQACARAVAALGATDDLEVIGAVAGLDPAECAEGVRALQELGGFARRHNTVILNPMVQDALQDTSTVEMRERLHERCARVLEAHGYPAERVAAQLMATSLPGGPWATRALRNAAEIAMKRRAPDVASRYLRRALQDASPDGEDRARLLVDLATCERTIDPSASARHISSAVPLFELPRDRAAAVVRIAPATLTDAPPAIRALIRQVADELGEPATLSGVDRELGLQLEARIRHLDRAHAAQLAESVRRLDELGSEPPCGTAAERELLTVLLYSAMVSARKPADEVARLGELILAREPALPSHVHTAMPMLVTALAVAESVTGVEAWLSRAIEQAERDGADLERAMILAEQATVAMWTGRFHDAKEAAREAYELAALDWNTAMSTSGMMLAGVAIATRGPGLGDLPLTSSPEPTGNAGLAAVRRMLRGAVTASKGDHRAALEHYLECGRQLQRSGWHNPVLFPWRAEAAELAQSLGESETARMLAEEDFVRARAWGTPSAIGRAQRILGNLITGKPGIAMLREAVSTLETAENRVELAHALLALGTRLQKSSAASAEAAELLHRCRELTLECGDHRLAERAGIELSPTARPVEPHNVLSKAEIRVAELLAAGLGNREIARRLGVGSRTIEKHLTNAYRKLGLQGRAGLIEAMKAAAAGQSSGRGKADVGRGAGTERAG